MMVRKWLSVLLVLALLLSAAAAEGELRGYSEEDGYIYVTFGQYFQSIDGGIPDDGKQAWQWSVQAKNEKKAAKKAKKEYDPGEANREPILWRVLDVDGERIFLLSEYVLFASVMHSNLKEFREIGANFENTELSRKLNGEFMAEAFTEEEQAAMMSRGTLGKVFLPDSEELKNPAFGFSSKKNQYGLRKAWATEYAIRVTGAYVYQPKNGKHNHTPYWLREQGTNDNRHARSIKNDGAIGTLAATGEDVGARPEIWLRPDAVRIDGGSGTKEDPYRLVPVPEETEVSVTEEIPNLK